MSSGVSRYVTSPSSSLSFSADEEQALEEKVSDGIAAYQRALSSAQDWVQELQDPKEAQEAAADAGAAQEAAAEPRRQLQEGAGRLPPAREGRAPRAAAQEPPAQPPRGGQDHVVLLQRRLGLGGGRHGGAQAHAAGDVAGDRARELRDQGARRREAQSAQLPRGVRQRQRRASSPAKKKRKTVAATAKVSVEVSSEPSPSPKKASKPKAAANAKSAWGALFAGQKGKKSLERARPLPAEPISADLKAKIQDFPAFEGVSKRSEDAEIKIVVWNVNGLRAVLKRDESVHLRAYVAQEDPDIFCLSETKICRDELQKLEDFLPQYEHQYWSCAVKKGYASTAIFSKTKPLSVKDEIIVGDHDSKGVSKSANGGKDQEGRFLALEYPKFWLVHTYVPNAGGKLERLDFRTNQWDKAMLREMKEMEKTKPVVWCGDLNVAHQEIDIHNPKGNKRSAGFTDEERESFGNILENGFVDTFRHLHPDKVEYSYFGYRHNMRAQNKGWRLDYFVVSEKLMPNVRSSYIRGSVVGSDHLPIGLELGGLS